MTHPELECLQLYLDQRLSDPERMAVDRHLGACAACAGRVENLRRLVTGLTAMNELVLPDTFASELTEELAPSPRLAVDPAGRKLLVQAALCVVILLTCGLLLLIIDTPVTDPSNDILGLIDIMLGSPFQERASAVAVLAVMVLAGGGVLVCLLAATPRIRPQRRVPAPSPTHSDPPR
ncbi:MAG TPA: zf-HC2 domain-containing protein [Chloroflexota bacterium]|nr:zf-HC2 domain-containing protein [Chloroflexota bacterium]